MQTFLPYGNFADCAKVLDNKRLGKQRVEVIQILNALRKPNYGWKHHPAVRMWRGYEWCLCVYGKMICQEWIRRGFKDTCYGKLDVTQREIMDSAPIGHKHEVPPWLDDVRLHHSHRGNLLRKDPAHYGQYWPQAIAAHTYWWPDENYQRGNQDEAA